MSSYLRRTKHPETQQWETAAWLDDHFGHHCYGVKFLDGKIFDPRDTVLNTTDGNVADDWDKFFPSVPEETLPSDAGLEGETEPLSSDSPRPEIELKEAVENLFDLKISSSGHYIGIKLPGVAEEMRAWVEYEDFLELRQSIESLIAQQADKLANERVKETLERLKLYPYYPVGPNDPYVTLRQIDEELANLPNNNAVTKGDE